MENTNQVSMENTNYSRETQPVENECGYNKDNPPQDDCCAICRSSFQSPCKTNCGHWFCSSCILQYWRHCAVAKQCQCPMCGSYVSKLLPHSRTQIQPTEEEAKTLKEIEDYYQEHRDNHKHRDMSIPRLLWFILRQAFIVPSWSWTRRRYRESFRENADTKNILNPLKRVMSLSALLLFLLYRVCICKPYGIEIFPYLGFEIVIGTEIFLFALNIFLLVDAAWHERGLEKRLEAAAAAQHQVE